MKRKKRYPSRANSLALAEINKEKRAKKIELFLLFLTLLSTSAFLILFTSHYLATGYASYIEGQAGYITEVVVEKVFPTTYWNGLYGLALKVAGFTEMISIDLNGEIDRQDLFFNCIDTTDPNGNEVYASTSATVDFATLVPATTAEANTFMSCSGRTDCADGTFTQNMSIMLGVQNISGIPSTYTYRWDGQNEIFNIGLLKDGSGDLVFVTHISTFQKGYSPNVTVNYQMLLPTPENTTVTYYFYTDPYDECPEGGDPGDIVEVNLSGYVKDEAENPIDNATVMFLGMIVQTDALGWYNFTGLVTEGGYFIITQKAGYDDAFSNITVTFTNTTFQENITLYNETPSTSELFVPHIEGYITDTAGVGLYDARVSIGGFSVQTDFFGYYSIYPSIIPVNQTIIAMLSGYNNNYTIINFSAQPPSVFLNMTLEEAIPASENLYFETGPYTENKFSDIQEEAIKNGDDYWVSTKEIKKEIRKNTFLEDVIGIYNFGSEMKLDIAISTSLDDVVEIEQSRLIIPKNTIGEIPLTFYGIRDIGIYKGNLSISGSIDQEIPITVEIIERRMPIETMLIKADIFNPIARQSEDLKYKITLQNLLSDQGYIVYITSKVVGANNSEVYATAKTQEEIASSLTLLEQIKLPDDIPNGEYNLKIQAKYLNLVSTVTVPFKVAQPIYLYAFFGIPLWIYLAVISFLSFILLNFFVYKRQMDKKKRYSVAVNYSELPGPGERTARLGHIAETSKEAYLELDKLTVHTIVAGATGMGKSISAQVLIEEALMKNICVIVFDPTAQWSGLLRKCEDKKMLSFYPKFKMKASDARGFPGNIRAVKDARQVIDINKYFEPGHIQIFTLNKLQPKDMDIFVANVIRQIFKSDPKESPTLKTLIVFDEVHRLLPKFGGTGEGFLQIERGCREFRKWGLGQVLISQVMGDFVGEIKANINTEVQTRTVEEGDLERIKSKYGESFLKSLVKSEVGVAMFQNAEYNKGLPYFINFRPILHNTRRLSDEELEKYNQYNDQVEDLGYQVEQLEELKIDVFDLKMELKLVKDKIMVGNFSVVDIYLEGLTPRIAKQWEKLGKKPKKKQIELADLAEIKKSVEEAKGERAKVEAKEKVQKAEEKVAEKKSENIDDKQLKALTLDNGAMLSTLGELKDLLPTLDDEIFKLHVNKQKNEISEWLKELSPGLATKIKPIIDKVEMIEQLKTTTKEDKKPQAKPKK